MTDAPASAPRALAPFSSIGADHPFAAGLDRSAERPAGIYDDVLAAR